MKITLLSLNHEVQWKDPTGDLHRILRELLSNSQIDLIAEEAFGLPTTAAQRLACRLDKPWIEIDMSIADRKLAGIHDAPAGITATRTTKNPRANTVAGLSAMSDRASPAIRWCNTPTKSCSIQRT